MIENAANHESPPGILLLAGRGSRLHPLTDNVNKNLLPIYNKPLALHSFEFLENSGIQKIVVIANPKDIDTFANLLECNKKAKTKVFYNVQEKPLGTADGIKQAEKFLTEDCFFSLWGDNLFEFNLEWSVGRNIDGLARLYLTRVSNPQDFGVIEINDDGKIIGIVDKPQIPKSNIICTGFMGFKSQVFDMVKNISPNKRGELDIMDAVRTIYNQGVLEHTFIRGGWIDAGVSFDTLLNASILAKERGLNK